MEFIIKVGRLITAGVLILGLILAIMILSSFFTKLLASFMGLVLIIIVFATCFDIFMEVKGL